jgi:hypothetical protein
MYGYWVGILLISESHEAPSPLCMTLTPRAFIGIFVSGVKFKKWGVLHYFQLATIMMEGPFLILGVFDQSPGSPKALLPPRSTQGIRLTSGNK